MLVNSKPTTLQPGDVMLWDSRRKTLHLSRPTGKGEESNQVIDTVLKKLVVGEHAFMTVTQLIAAACGLGLEQGKRETDGVYVTKFTQREPS